MLAAITATYPSTHPSPAQDKIPYRRSGGNKNAFVHELFTLVVVVVCGVIAARLLRPLTLLYAFPTDLHS